MKIKREQGYVGSSSSIRHYITKCKKKYKNDRVAPQNSTENKKRTDISVGIKHQAIQIKNHIHRNLFQRSC